MSIFPRTKPLGDPSALCHPSPGAGWDRRQGCRGLGAIWLLDKLGIAPRQHPRHTNFLSPSHFLHGFMALTHFGSRAQPGLPGRGSSSWCVPLPVAFTKQIS